MDSCTVPGAINYCHTIIGESLDTCEGGRFSCYISSDMVMVPCSFDREQKYAVRLKDEAGEEVSSIEDAWNSETFDAFRGIMSSACPGCKKRECCMGGCPLMPEIVLCNIKQ